MSLILRRTLVTIKPTIFQPKAPLTKQSLTNLQTADLLQKLGFYNKTHSGLFHWLPLGLRSLNKLNNIITTTLTEDLNATPVSLSLLSPKSLWETTHRWNNTELFKLTDSKKAQYCLVATYAEDITQLMRQYITSYKDMPLIVFQIGRKYRDEKRPRGGLLRGREFVMLDAYSFAADDSTAMELFDAVNGSFNKIFAKLKVPFVRAWADNGIIGGDVSMEYHFVHSSGEDTLFRCSNPECGHVSTLEKTEGLPIIPGQHNGDVDVRYALSGDHNTLICFYFPVSRELNWGNAREAVDNDLDFDLLELTNDKVLEIFRRDNPDMMFVNVLRVMDIRLNYRSNFPDFPLREYMKNNFAQIDGVPLVNAIDGDLCGKCEQGTLNGSRCIEVGHTFNLGTKYSVPLDVTFADRDNTTSKHVKMGCYGIGVSRVIAAIAEVMRDPYGFRWPSSISPYLVSLCSVPGTKGSALAEQVEAKLKGSTRLRGEVMSSFHDGMGLGSKIALSHAIGIPLCIIVGPKTWPRVEIEVRGKRWGESAKNPKWKSVYPSLRKVYQWEVSEFPTTASGNTEGSSPVQEKHLVSLEHLNDVVDIILDDI